VEGGGRARWSIRLTSRDEDIAQRQREFAHLSVLAVFIGVVAAILAVLFRYFIEWIFGVAFADPEDLLNMAWWDRAKYALIPAIGGLLVGPIIWFAAREAKGHGVPEVMDAVIRFGGRIRLRVVGVKALASAITIGTGGSSGREGPIVHMGSAIGSNVGQFLHLNPAQTKILLGCGAAAGITATFNTPIAGVLFAIEIILMEFKTRSFIPIVIASVIATLVAPAFDGTIQHALTGVWPADIWKITPAFNVPEFPVIPPQELFAFLALGIICGLLALIYIKFLYRAEDFFEAIKAKPWLKPAMGGLVLGALGLAFPWVHGVGYSTIEDVLNSQFGGTDGSSTISMTIIALMAVLALVKILGVSLTLGSGGSGGIFAPALFIGAMAGGAFGAVVNNYFPGTADYGAYALVAMAALVAASTRGTLTAILMIFEMTRAYDIILPLLFACVIADMVATMGSPETIYTRKLLRRGVKIVHDLEPNVMQLFTMREVMVPREEVVTLSPGDALHKVVAVIRRTGHNGFPVLDGEGKLVGVVTFEDTRNAHNRGDLFIKVGEMMTTDIVTVTPYETGEVALRRMGDRRVSHLPVVDPYDSTKLMGWISKGDVVFAYEDHYRRMEAPFCDDAAMGTVCEPQDVTPVEEEVLTPPSLIGRIFGKRRPKEAPPSTGGEEPGPEEVTGETPEVAEVEVVEVGAVEEAEAEGPEEAVPVREVTVVVLEEPKRARPVKVERIKGRKL
jgi:CIC family chloride channel protein